MLYRCWVVAGLLAGLVCISSAPSLAQAPSVEGSQAAEQLSLQWRLLRETSRVGERREWTRVLLDLEPGKASQVTTVARVSIKPEQVAELLNTDAEKWVNQWIETPLLDALPNRAMAYLPQKELLVKLAEVLQQRSLALHVGFDDERKPTGEMVFEGAEGEAEAATRLRRGLNGVEMLFLDGDTLRRIPGEIDVYLDENYEEFLCTARNGHAFVPADGLPEDRTAFEVFPAGCVGSQSVQYDPLVDAGRQLVILKLDPTKHAGADVLIGELAGNPHHCGDAVGTCTIRYELAEVGMVSAFQLILDHHESVRDRVPAHHVSTEDPDRLFPTLYFDLEPKSIAQNCQIVFLR